MRGLGWAIVTKQSHAELVASLVARWPESHPQPSLERIAALCELLGDPQRSCPVIQITGTNGKGSTAIMIDALLRSLGLRIDCGGYSVGGELAEGEDTKYLQDIIRDIGLMACGLWLWIRPRSVLAVDNWLLAPVDSGLADDEDLDPIEEDQAAVARR